MLFGKLEERKSSNESVDCFERLGNGMLTKLSQGFILIGKVLNWISVLIKNTFYLKNIRSDWTLIKNVLKPIRKDYKQKVEDKKMFPEKYAF